MIALDLDTGFRPYAFDIGADYYFDKFIAAEVRFIDEGEQPDGIRNVNRTINLDGVVAYPFWHWSVFAKAGLTSSYLSYNGSGNGYHNDTGFTGVNYGAGISYALTETWSVQAQVINMNYQQSDKPAYENFTYGSIGVRYEFN